MVNNSPTRGVLPFENVPIGQVMNMAGLGKSYNLAIADIVTRETAPLKSPIKGLASPSE